MQNEPKGLFMHFFSMAGVSCASSVQRLHEQGGGLSGATCQAQLNLKQELHAKTGEDGFSANSFSLLTGAAKPEMSCRTGEKGLGLS